MLRIIIFTLAATLGEEPVLPEIKQQPRYEIVAIK